MIVTLLYLIVCLLSEEIWLNMELFKWIIVIEGIVTIIGWLDK